MRSPSEIAGIVTMWSSLDHTLICSNDRGDVAPGRDPASISDRTAVICLGYVGLPAEIAFAKKCDHVTGIEISEARIDALHARRTIGPHLTPGTIVKSLL